MHLVSTLSLEPGVVIQSWDFLACNWTTAPAQVGTSTVSGQPGTVYSYTFGGVTRFRFVPDTYSAALDGFWGGFSGGVLSGFIVSRG